MAVGESLESLTAFFQFAAKEKNGDVCGSPACTVVPSFTTARPLARVFTPLVSLFVVVVPRGKHKRRAKVITWHNIV